MEYVHISRLHRSLQPYLPSRKNHVPAILSPSVYLLLVPCVHVLLPDPRGFGFHTRHLICEELRNVELTLGLVRRKMLVDGSPVVEFVVSFLLARIPMLDGKRK